MFYKTISMAKFHDNRHTIHKFIKRFGSIGFHRAFQTGDLILVKDCGYCVTNSNDQRSNKETTFGHLISEYRPLSHNEDIIFLTTKTPILQGFVFFSARQDFESSDYHFAYKTKL